MKLIAIWETRKIRNDKGVGHKSFLSQTTDRGRILNWTKISKSHHYSQCSTIFTKSSLHQIPNPTILDPKFPIPPKFANPNPEGDQIV